MESKGLQNKETDETREKKAALEDKQQRERKGEILQRKILLNLNENEWFQFLIYTLGVEEKSQESYLILV
ncbi:hypothetical protein A2121_03105 [Candidatus Nomurabacteria bacterium GWB1_40_6]|uniref:Uncharacterized protein n=1 Tax=Candidatus Nomurabacteria bacterium GWB1_40_6 TaxID=1801727 RepID=A0A1F6TKN5_9BACT|nr:MAG: hypothetical protein A2121_03105 [Candidatus Nomurabacteria bacterium GWB1_40_6]